MKKAVSMIELVISIVIIGIVVTSMPTILTQTNDNQELAIKQESIMAAKTRMAQVMSKDWDNNSYVFGDSLSYIVNVPTSANTWLNDRNGTLGTSLFKRNKTTAGASASTTLGGDGNRNDADDFDGTSIALGPSSINTTGTSITNAGNLDFAFRSGIRIGTTVSYSNNTENALNYNQRSISFNFTNANSPNPTHMKRISIVITGIGDSNITLNSFMSNIGQSSLPWRDF